MVCDFIVWGGNLTAQKAFFQRYADTNTNAHALVVWREEAHEETTVYRLGIGRGTDKTYDIAWLGLGADEPLETVTDVTVYLPPRADRDGVLQYTTRGTDGTETTYSVPAQSLVSGEAEDGGLWLTIPEADPVIGDSIQLTAE